MNKFVWSAMGEDASLTVRQVVRQYVLFFLLTLSKKLQRDFGLESNWIGYARSNKAFGTLKNFQQAVHGLESPSSQKLAAANVPAEH